MAMGAPDTREAWQRGPVEGVPPLLQPIAHALVQAGEELTKFTNDFPDDLLWEKPANLASVGFHLLHIKGIIDRLFTYARGEMLNADQLKALSAEQQITTAPAQVSDLVQSVYHQIDRAINQLKNTDPSTLTDRRTLGRKQIPTTVSGLLFHAAEHTQRHVGQLLVTTRVLLKSNPGKG